MSLKTEAMSNTEATSRTMTAAPSVRPRRANQIAPSRDGGNGAELMQDSSRGVCAPVSERLHPRSYGFRRSTSAAQPETTMTSRLLLNFALALAALGCGSTYEQRDPTGETFPSVTGESLEGTEYRIPEAFAGEPVLLLVGYDQDTQFDIDRWLLGLTQAGVTIRVHELPTIPGLAPRMFSGSIDKGMRSGIPSEDWGAVITVYGDGDKIARLTGNKNSLPGRVILLDANGRVIFFHDRGYSVGTLQRLRSTIQTERTK
jgi:hypothetical protein